MWRESSPWRQLRRESKVSQKTVATAMGTSLTNLKRIETGVQSFEPRHILALANLCKYDSILLLAEIERWMSMKPNQASDTATRIAKKIHVGNNPLRKRREAMGMNAQEFSEAVGCDRFCVYKTENGITNPQAMTLNRFAEVLAVNPDILKEELAEWKKIMNEKDPYQIIEDGLKEEKESNATQ